MGRGRAALSLGLGLACQRPQGREEVGVSGEAGERRSKLGLGKHEVFIFQEIGSHLPHPH